MVLISCHTYLKYILKNGFRKMERDDNEIDQVVEWYIPAILMFSLVCSERVSSCTVNMCAVPI
jgi:hypothetical protein